MIVSRKSIRNNHFRYMYSHSSFCNVRFTNTINRINKTTKAPLFGPARCPVYLCLPWKGQESTKVTVCSAVKSVVRRTYYAVQFVPVFTTMRAFMVRKDVLPALHLSHLIYNFECRQCASRYVGRTVQHLNARIKQHTPRHILPPCAQQQRPKRGRPRKQPLPTQLADPGSQTVLAPPSLVAVVEEGGRGGSSGRLVSPPLLLASVVPSSVPPAALAGVVPLAVPVPLPPPDPPPSALAVVELASDRPRATPTVALTLQLPTQKDPPCVSAAPTPSPTMQSTTTTTNPPSKPTSERPRRSTANYNRSYALKGQGRKEGRDSRVTAESRTKSGGIKERAQRKRMMGRTVKGATSRRATIVVIVRVPVRMLVLCVGFVGSKSSVYNHLLASPDCCNSYSDSSFTVLCRGRHGYGLQLKVLEAICQRLYKPNLCVQKDSIIGLKLFK